MNRAARSKAATLPIALAVALIALALLGPASALARDGGGGGGGGGGGRSRPEVRAAGACGRGAASSLKLKARDGVIEAEFEVHGRAHSLWRVVFVREGRVAWRGRVRSGRTSHSVSVERRLSDFPGADQVMARAIGPRGVTCQATATLPG